MQLNRGFYVEEAFVWHLERQLSLPWHLDSELQAAAGCCRLQAAWLRPWAGSQASTVSGSPAARRSSQRSGRFAKDCIDLSRKENTVLPKVLAMSFPGGSSMKDVVLSRIVATTKAEMTLDSGQQ